MDHFNYKNGQLFVEDVNVSTLAESYGTPCYIYSRATIERHWRAFDQAFGQHPHLVCYAVKANSNLAVLNVMARLGSGFDIVSAGELERVLRAGGRADRIVFSGVGKTAAELERALEAGIRCFNVESISELERLNRVAGRLGKSAPVSIRVNPDVDAHTHPYISTGLKENKFGIDISSAKDIYRQAADMAHIDVHGVDCHIGSQLTDNTPFIDALGRVLELIDQLAADGISIRHLDIGGGLGIRYQHENPPKPAEYAQAIMQHLGDRDIEVLIEPGRAIVGNAGILLTRVEYLKLGEHKHFAIVDAAMNDLLRPALYSAWQEIIPVRQDSTATARVYDVVGPICETGDFLGKERELAIQEGDLLAVRSSGAYGFGMSSNYNSRPRAAEIMVDGAQAYLIRNRESIDELMAGETLLP
jgi:diaminopimelate decarboxylase